MEAAALLFAAALTWERRAANLCSPAELNSLLLLLPSVSSTRCPGAAARCRHGDVHSTAPQPQLHPTSTHSPAGSTVSTNGDMGMPTLLPAVLAEVKAPIY